MVSFNPEAGGELVVLRENQRQGLVTPSCLLKGAGLFLEPVLPGLGVLS